LTGFSAAGGTTIYARGSRIPTFSRLRLRQANSKSARKLAAPRAGALDALTKPGKVGSADISGVAEKARQAICTPRVRPSPLEHEASSLIVKSWARNHFPRASCKPHNRATTSNKKPEDVRVDGGPPALAGAPGPRKTKPDETKNRRGW